MADEKNILKNGERRIGVAEEGRFRPRNPAVAFGRYFLGSCLLAAAVGCGGAAKQQERNVEKPAAVAEADVKVPEAAADGKRRLLQVAGCGPGGWGPLYRGDTLLLRDFHAEDVPGIIEEMKDGDLRKRIGGACISWEIARGYPEYEYSQAIPGWIAVLKESDAQLRSGKWGATDQGEILPAYLVSNQMIFLMEDILERCKPEYLEGHPEYVEGFLSLVVSRMGDADGVGKATAAALIGKIAEKNPGLDYSAAVAGLLKNVDAEGADGKTKAGRALAGIRNKGITSPSGIPALISMLGSKDSYIRAMAAYRIGEIYPKEERVESPCLTDVERIEKKFGKKGVKVLDLIDGERTAENIMKRAGLSEAGILAILEYMQWLGAIKLDYPGYEKPKAGSLSYSEQNKKEYLREQLRALKGLLKNGTPQQRGGAAKALGEIGDGETTDELISAAFDKNNEVRMSAIGALGEFAGTCAIYSVSNGLRDKSDDVRMEAAQAMRKIAIRNLADKGVGSAIDSLMAAGSEDRCKYFSSENAIEALGDIAVAAKGKEGRLYERIFSWVKGRHIYSEAVVNALGKMGDRRAVPTLIGILERENGWNWNERVYVWDMVCSALGSIGDARATEVIARGLAYAEEASFYGEYTEKIRIKARIRLALSQMGEEAVFKALGAGSDDVRRGAVIGLRHMDGGRVVPALIKALEDKDHDVVMYAKGILKSKLGSDKTDPETKAAIGRALEKREKET